MFMETAGDDTTNIFMLENSWINLSIHLTNCLAKLICYLGAYCWAQDGLCEHNWIYCWVENKLDKYALCVRGKKLHLHHQTEAKSKLSLCQYILQNIFCFKVWIRWKRYVFVGNYKRSYTIRQFFFLLQIRFVVCHF